MDLPRINPWHTCEHPHKKGFSREFSRRSPKIRVFQTLEVTPLHLTIHYYVKLNTFFDIEYQRGECFTFRVGSKRTRALKHARNHDFNPQIFSSITTFLFVVFIYLFIYYLRKKLISTQCTRYFLNCDRKLRIHRKKKKEYIGITRNKKYLSLVLSRCNFFEHVLVIVTFLSARKRPFASNWNDSAAVPTKARRPPRAFFVAGRIEFYPSLKL